MRQLQESLDTEQKTQATDRQEIETLQPQQTEADIDRRASELAVIQLSNAFDIMRNASEPHFSPDRNVRAVERLTIRSRPIHQTLKPVFCRPPNRLPMRI